VHPKKENGDGVRDDYESRLASKDQEILELQQRLARWINTLTTFIRKYSIFNLEQDHDPLVQEVKDILLETGSLTEKVCGNDYGSPSTPISSRQTSFLQAEMATLKLNAAVLESRNSHLEVELKRYRQALRTFKTHMDEYRENVRHYYASKLYHREAEINTLNEKISQLLNNAGSVTTPFPASNPAPSPMSPIDFGRNKVLPPLPRIRPSG
jgi:predicted  nucleic acid-binding Zn-ribbon protein